MSDYAGYTVLHFYVALWLSSVYFIISSQSGFSPGLCSSEIVGSLGTIEGHIVPI